MADLVAPLKAVRLTLLDAGGGTSATHFSPHTSTPPHLPHKCPTHPAHPHTPIPTAPHPPLRPPWQDLCRRGCDQRGVGVPDARPKEAVVGRRRHRAAARRFGGGAWRGLKG
eukprot:365145-Chlamydomonas_euryale.AAC.29